jgi:hypothetical protein
MRGHSIVGSLGSRFIIWLCVCGSVLSTLSCDIQTPHQAFATSTAVVVAEVIGVPGYQHLFAQSLFKPGDGPRTISDAGFSKIVGSTGVFGVDQINGAVWAIPNADAPSAKRPPYTGSGTDHDARVKTYFVNAGLPADQIAAVQTHAMMQGGMDELGRRIPDSLVAYYSVLSRAVSKIPVAESYAWARFNVDGEVVEEGVCWPPLSAAAIGNANDLLMLAADPPSLSDLADKINQAQPGFGNANGRVVIHHNLSTDRGVPFVVATYDSAVVPNGRSTLHFDRYGHRINFPHEVPGPSSARR